MIPELHEKTYHGSGTSTQIGRLPAWIECKVIEERNGEFYLEGTLPVGAQNVDKLEVDRIILAASCPERDFYNERQPFRIRKIEKPEGQDVMRILAHHVSYELSQKVLVPDFAIIDQVWYTVQSLFNYFLNMVGSDDNSADWVLPPLGGKFNFVSDIESESQKIVKHIEPMSVKAFLGNGDESVQGVFGGEFDWDGWTVHLYSARGQYKPDIVVSYGKNMESLQFGKDTAEMVNGYYGYYQGEGSSFQGSDIIYKTGYNNFAYPRIAIVNLSSEFEVEQGDPPPSKEEVNGVTSAYALAQDTGSLPASVTVSAVPDLLQGVFLCDTIKVLHPAYNLIEYAKIVRTVYDPIRERYVEMTIGEIEKGITDTVARMLRRNKDDFTRI